MSLEFPWANNPLKLNRAKVWAEEQVRSGAEPKLTEALVRSRYEALGGLVVEDLFVRDEEVAEQEQGATAPKTAPKTGK